jgi:MFS family permease
MHLTRKQIHVMTVGLLLANVMSGLDATIINTALPAIIADLHGISCMGLIVSVFLLGMSVFTPLWSKFGERMGNKKAFELAVVLFIAGSALEGLSPDILFFVCARLLMGIGAGGLGSIPYIIFGNVYENLHTRSIILGFVSAVYGAASITGPLVGGLIVDSFSWHWIFYINVPIGLLIIAIIHFSYKEKVESVDKKVDWLGSFLLVSGLTCILMGIQFIGNESEMLVIGLIVSGIILCFCLVQAEKKASDPVMPLHIFKDRLLVLDFALFAVIWGASIAFNTYIPLWAQGLLGMSALMGGLTQIPASVFDFAGSQLSASIRERWSFAGAVNLGILSLAVAEFGLLVAKSSASFVFLCIVAAFGGFAVGLIFNVLQIKVQYDSSKQDMAVATSFSFLIRILGQTLMASIYGVLMNVALNRGVKRSGGRITLAMMNKLSDAKSARNLPQELLPQMRTIMHSGIQIIMTVALMLLVLAFYLNIKCKKAARKPS